MNIVTEQGHDVHYFLHKTVVDVLFYFLSQSEETIISIVKTEVDVLQFQKTKVCLNCQVTTLG